MRYYETEPEAVYQQVAREHTTQWSDAFEPGHPGGFDDFPNRAFLERVLPELGGVADVLEYGCGTGPAACFLAQRGLRVDAVDVSPEAIRLARLFADERGLLVNFAVQDVCRWPAADKRYDLVVDSYCLQNIVLDEDRAALFRGARDRLAPTGHYLISTALYEPDRVYGNGLRYDAATGVCYREGLPYRRHLTAAALHAELTAAGFTVLSLIDGNVVSRRASGDHRSRAGAGGDTGRREQRAAVGDRVLHAVPVVVAGGVDRPGAADHLHHRAR
ncbi:class I SAM-dependent methyltransferase [Kribbella turkmenica]|uniref:Class I SAM-dependent methyltransferase n=1 Tax=Kribbella turkmenica TaxID=2530375 RepID=A0A4V2YGT1_9ACTN|nr:class I SAM-dependent methyltransferase [Kribbella turkmenica]TDD28267.1 class I SAM-dependent methyltransferase [Kribbella turkmenica]